MVRRGRLCDPSASFSLPHGATYQFCSQAPPKTEYLGLFAQSHSCFTALKTSPSVLNSPGSANHNEQSQNSATWTRMQYASVREESLLCDDMTFSTALQRPRPPHSIPITSLGHCTPWVRIFPQHSWRYAPEKCREPGEEQSAGRSQRPEGTLSSRKPQVCVFPQAIWSWCIA